MTGKGKTIKDIAEMAGVSKATVSRVMNNSGYVAAETRTKIENLMKEYDYMPSALAVNLSRQETSTIGVVVPEIGNTFYADILHGVTQVADELDLSLVFSIRRTAWSGREELFGYSSSRKYGGLSLARRSTIRRPGKEEPFLRH